MNIEKDDYYYMIIILGKRIKCKPRDSALCQCLSPPPPPPAPSPQTFETISNQNQVFTPGQDCHQTPSNLISSPAGFCRTSADMELQSCTSFRGRHSRGGRRESWRRERQRGTAAADRAELRAFQMKAFQLSK